jgi:uncharacterized membrane protein
MIRKLDKMDVAAVALLAGAGAITAVLYERLPARVPTHFNAHGVANGWMDRPVGAFILLFGGLVAWGFARFAKVIVPASWRGRIAEAPMAAAAFIFAASFTAFQVLFLYAATHRGESIGRGLAIAMGALWLALGQLMPRLRRNPILGIRTAWTLTSDENWLRTHRVAGYTFAAGGLVALMAGLAGGAMASSIATAAVITSGIAPAVYSYFLARRLPPST